MASREPLKIVRLDALHAPDPTFTIPHSYTAHHNTPHDQDIIISRLKDADVVITTLSECPLNWNPSWIVLKKKREKKREKERKILKNTVNHHKVLLSCG